MTLSPTEFTILWWGLATLALTLGAIITYNDW